MIDGDGCQSRRDPAKPIHSASGCLGVRWKHSSTPLTCPSVTSGMA